MKTTNLLFLFSFFTVIYSNAQLAGNALHFDATNGYCSSALPTVFENIPTNNFTVECWVKPETLSASKRILFAQKDANNFCSILVNSSNVAYFFVQDNGISYSVNTQNTLSTSEWTHLAFVWNAGSNTITSFINGIQINGISGGGSSTGVNDLMTIGARTDGQQLIKGGIDELRIWDDMRTPCEIFAGRNTTFTTSQANLVASYNFNHGVADGNNAGITTLEDMTNNYDASLTGFVLNGTSSNWVSSGASVSQLNNNSETFITDDIITACESYTWIDNNTYYANNSTATHSYLSPNGCDCLVNLDLNIDSPVSADNLGNISSCETFELPTLSNGNYYTSSSGAGTQLNPGDFISSSQTLYVYNENGLCNAENAFTVTIDTPVSADAPNDVSSCENYELPDLSVGSYYTVGNGGGTQLNAGEIISSTQTIFVYAENGSCNDENVFLVSIDQNPSNTVTVDAKTLVADQSGASYQWLDCDNGNSPIAGETNQVFVPMNNGNYAVQITSGTCSNVSDCQLINSIGLTQIEEGALVEVSPNPTSGELTLYLANQEQTRIEIYNSTGALISQITTSTKGNKLNIQGEDGVYFIRVMNNNYSETIRLIKH